MMDILIVILVAGYCGYLIRWGYKKKKEGKSIGCTGCGGNCTSCGSCHQYSSPGTNRGDHS